MGVPVAWAGRAEVGAETGVPLAAVAGIPGTGGEVAGTAAGVWQRETQGYSAVPTNATSNESSGAHRRKRFFRLCAE